MGLPGTQVLAALGDAPTAVIAVLAIALGVFLAARGPREKRAAADAGDHAEASAPTLLKLPVASAPDTEADVEPGFVGPQGEVVGHGRIRLGAVGPLGGGEPAAAQAAPEPAEPEPAPEPEPEPEPQPEPEAAAPQPAAPEPAAPEPAAPEAPAAEPARVEAPPAASEQALFTSPPTLPDPAAAPQDDAETPPAAASDAPPAADAAADPPKEPAWRIFRQGTTKLGGKPAKKDED